MTTAQVPDFDGLSDEDLDTLIDRLVDDELELSRRRRIVHRRLDVLWTERQNRRRRPASD